MPDRTARNRAHASGTKRAPSPRSRGAARAAFDPDSLQPPLAPDESRALVTTAPPEAKRDAHGFDPEDYDWIPVKRHRRLGGWTDSLQRSFIETLADTCSVTEAARAVGMSTNSCYRLRHAPGGESFARAWDAAIHASANRLVDALFDRALNGVEQIVFDKHGQRVGAQIRYDNRLAMQLVRAHLPERYGRPRLGPPGPAPVPAPVPAPIPAVAQALVALTPVTPPDPHLLLPPDRLAAEIAVADVGEGSLPRWHRDPDPDPEPEIDHAFERRLEAIKHLGRGATKAQCEAAIRAAEAAAAVQAAGGDEASD